MASAGCRVDRYRDVGRLTGFLLHAKPALPPSMVVGHGRQAPMDGLSGRHPARPCIGPDVSDHPGSQCGFYHYLSAYSET